MNVHLRLQPVDLSNCFRPFITVALWAGYTYSLEQMSSHLAWEALRIVRCAATRVLCPQTRPSNSIAQLHINVAADVTSNNRGRTPVHDFVHLFLRESDELLWNDCYKRGLWRPSRVEDYPLTTHVGSIELCREEGAAQLEVGAGGLEWVEESKWPVSLELWKEIRRARRELGWDGGKKRKRECDDDAE